MLCPQNVMQSVLAVLWQGMHLNLGMLLVESPLKRVGPFQNALFVVWHGPGAARTGIWRVVHGWPRAACQMYPSEWASGEQSTSCLISTMENMCIFITYCKVSGTPLLKNIFCIQIYYIRPKAITNFVYTNK